MAAIDDLLDARVSHAEIAEYLCISTQAVRLRCLQRDLEALQAAREGWGARVVAGPVADGAVGRPKP